MHEEYSTKGVGAIGRIDSTDDEGAQSLETACVDWHLRCERAKWASCVPYFENISYLLGNHLTRFFLFDGTLGTFTFGVDDWSESDDAVAKVADNRLIRPVEEVAATLTRTRPSPRVRPRTRTPEDEDAARISELLLDLVWEQPLVMGQKLYDAAMIAATCGTAVAETEFGLSWRPLEQTEEEAGALEDGEGEPEFAGYADELRVRMFTRFHINVDPTATSPEDMRWISRTTYQDVEWVKEHFGPARGRTRANGYFTENAESVAEESSTDSPLYWWTRIQELIEAPQSLRGGGTAPWSDGDGFAPGQTTVTIWDVRPTREYPRGRTIVIAGGKLVYSSPRKTGARAWHPRYRWRWHGYSFFGWFRVPGRFWDAPLLSFLVPLQKKINAIDAIVHANRQYIGVGQWMFPTHSKVKEGMVGGIPGEGFEYVDLGSGYRAPEKVKNVPLPGELFAEREILILAIAVISGTGTGGAQDLVSPSAARSGPVLDFLRREKLESKTPMVLAFERFLESISQNVLIELQIGLVDEDPELTSRLAVAAREHSSLTIESFTGASLRDHHAVEIDIASELLKSPEADEANALEAAQAMGQSMTAPQREGVFRVLGLDEFMENAQNLTVDRVRRMVSRVVQGRLDKIMPLEQIDDAAAAADVLRNTMLEDRFNDLDPKVQRIIMDGFDAYFEIHQREVAQAMMMQAQMATMQKGAGKPAAQ